MTRTLKVISAARPLAPEDIRPGRYVCVLREYTDHTCSVEWRVDLRERSRVVRSRCADIPAPTDNLPLMVEAICLPLVFVRDAFGKPRMLDVRCADLASVSPEFAEFVFARLRSQRAGS